MQNQKFLIPFILATSLFFLREIVNTRNAALIAQFQPVFDISRAQALLAGTAFYPGYFTIVTPAGSGIRQCVWVPVFSFLFVACHEFAGYKHSHYFEKPEAGQLRAQSCNHV